MSFRQLPALGPDGEAYLITEFQDETQHQQQAQHDAAFHADVALRIGQRAQADPPRPAIHHHRRRTDPDGGVSAHACGEWSIIDQAS